MSVYINRNSKVLTVLPGIRDEGDNYLRMFQDICLGANLETDISEFDSEGLEFEYILNKIIDKDYLIISGKGTFGRLFVEEFMELPFSLLLNGLDFEKEMLSDEFKPFADNMKLKKIYFINSTKASFYKGENNTIQSQVENVTSKIFGTSTVHTVKKEMYHIREFAEHISAFDKEPLLGFDFETNDFRVFMSHFRLTGIGVSSLTVGHYYYFSIDRDEYKKELAYCYEVVRNWTFANKDRLIPYNAKFEQQVIYKSFHLDVELNDAYVLCKVKQMPDGLKKNAVNILGVEMWNEGSQDIIKSFDTVKNSIYKVRSTNLDKLEKATKSLVELNDKLLFSKTNDLITELPDLDVEKSTGKKVTAAERRTFKDLVSTITHLLQEKLIINQFFEHGVYNGGFNNLEKEFNILLRYHSSEDILKYIREDYTGWEIVPHEILGEYCILDCLYTLKIWNKMYTPDIVKSYPVYRAQTYIAAIMERNGIVYDNELMKKMDEDYTRELLNFFKLVLEHPDVKKMVWSNERGTVIKDIMKSVTLEDSVKKQFDYDKPLTKYMKDDLSDIGNDSRVNEILKELAISINPAFEQDITMLENNLPTIKKNIRREAEKAAEIVIQQPHTTYLKAKLDRMSNHSRDIPIKQAISAELERLGDSTITVEEYNKDIIDRDIINCKTLDDYKRFYNPGSNTEYHSRVLWSSVMTDELVALMSLNNVSDILEQLLNETNPEIIKQLGDLKGSEKADFVSGIVDRALDNEFGDTVKSKILKAYSQGESRAHEIAHNGRNAEDMKSVINVFKNLMAKDRDALSDWENYPDNIKLVYYWNSIKKILKVTSTYIKGTTGYLNGYTTRKVDLGPYSYYERVKKIDPSVGITDDMTEDIINDTDFRDNSKSTLRWSSGVHGIPKMMEFMAAMKPREEDMAIVQWDKSQAEYRLVTGMNLEKMVVKAARSGLDVHLVNAAAMTRKDPTLALDSCDEAVNSFERGTAKIFVFGILYGKSVASIANDFFHGDVEYAQKLYDDFLSGIAGVEKWIEDRHQQVMDTGKTTLPYFDHDMVIGRPANKYAPELRQAVNYPIQSASSSFCAYQGYLVYKECINQGIKAYPTAFIHDSFIFEVEFSKLHQFYLILDWFYKEWPYQTMFIADNFDMEVGLNQAPKKSEITYEIVETENGKKVRYKTDFRDFYADKDMEAKYDKYLPNHRIISKKEKKKVIVDTISGFETKVSYNLSKDKEITYYAVEGEFDYQEMKEFLPAYSLGSKVYEDMAKAQEAS